MLNNWYNFIFIFLAFLSLLLSQCSNVGSIKNTPKCVTTNNQNEYHKIIKILNIRVSDLERHLININFLIKDNKLTFRFRSMKNDINIYFGKESEGIFKFSEINAYLGIREIIQDSGYRSSQVWIEKSKKELFIPLKSIGEIENNQNCLEPEDLKFRYDQAYLDMQGLMDEPDGVQKQEKGIHIINSESVLIRDKPSIKGKVLQKLSKDSIVYVIKVEEEYEKIDPYGKNPWLKIQLPNKKVGYIFGAFLDWKEPLPADYEYSE